MTTITNNTELYKFAEALDPNAVLYAIRTKGKIEIFASKKAFNKKAKLLPDAVQGQFTCDNFFYYRFVIFS